NVFAPILVIATVWLGNAIVIEAALSFLGLGTPPPTPTWGGMLAGEGRRNLETAPHLALFPGVAISIVVLAFNMLGDALRVVLDPRLRNPYLSVGDRGACLDKPTQRRLGSRHGPPAPRRRIDDHEIALRAARHRRGPAGTAHARADAEARAPPHRRSHGGDRR